MPFDITPANGGGGGGEPSEFERALAIIVGTAMAARPNFGATPEETTERVQLEVVIRVNPAGNAFSPFGLMVLEWAKIEFEDPEDDPGKDIKFGEGTGG